MRYRKPSGFFRGPYIYIMAKVLLIVVLAVMIGACFASLFRQDDTATHWTNLSAKFGIGFRSFRGLPRTEKEAVSGGWALLGEDSCSGNALFYGRRFAYEKDPTLVLLFDIKGVIAGIQIGARKSELEVEGNDYPYGTTPSFVLDNVGGEDYYYITTYFDDPGKICTEGRTEDQLLIDGTATGVFFQRGNRDMSVRITEDEKSLKNTSFTPEKCLMSMGNHYFWNLTEDMDCRELQPTFILTKYGRVLGFGHVFIGEASGATYVGGFEHPGMTAVRAIVKHVPKCLSSYADRFKLTSLHVYFVEHPVLINCFWQ